MPILPDEIVLQILAHTDPRTVCLSTANASTQLRRCSQTHMVEVLLPKLLMSTTFTLGSGSQHRWYDIKATFHFRFSHLASTEADKAFFRFSYLYPSRCEVAALEKWRNARLYDPTGRDLKWTVAFDGSTEGREPAEALVFDAEDGSVQISLRWAAVLRDYYLSKGEASWKYAAAGSIEQDRRC